jgi:hypothetical protein
VDNGDGTFNVQFSEPATLISTGSDAFAFLSDNVTYPAALQQITWNSQVNDDTIQMSPSNPVTVPGAVLFAAQSSYITTTDPVQTGVYFG